MTERIDSDGVDKLIKKAADKIGADKENDICRYIPVPTGGYIHHFTMRKMRGEDPAKLAQLLEQHILKIEEPKKVRPKPRAARGSRKRRDQFLFSKQDVEKMLHMARLAGEKEIIRKLTPKRDLRTIKRELISSIRHNRVEQELWDSYAETLQAHGPDEQHLQSMGQ